MAQKSGERGRFQVPTFRGTGLRPGVDLDETGRLLDIMDGLADASGIRRKLKDDSLE